MQQIILNGFTPEQFREFFKESFKEIAEQLIYANAVSISAKPSAGNLKLQEKLEEVYLTRLQAANYLQISLPTLHQYTKDGVIISYRMGNKIRYKLTEISLAMKERNFGKKI